LVTNYEGLIEFRRKKSVKSFDFEFSGMKVKNRRLDGIEKKRGFETRLT
jgi:hypothetical protein